MVRTPSRWRCFKWVVIVPFSIILVIQKHFVIKELSISDMAAFVLNAL